MTASFTILVIDDEQVVRDACDQILSREGCRVTFAASGAEGLDKIKRERFDVIILDLRMPVLSGMEVLARIDEYIREIPVIVITGYATVESAVEAMKLGAYDFIPKPFTPNALRTIVVRALKKRLSLGNTDLREELETCGGTKLLIGRSKAMQRVFRLIEKAGKTDSTLLISGQSGTGKELVARAVHCLSRRRDGPFITVDCNSVVSTLFESELFGHVKGAFTGATVTKKGRFELAQGGTLFLDEIGDMDLAVQGKLLRVLQEREIVRVGSAQIIHTDVRIIAATNKDLWAETREGEFREDLFYRLSVIPIHLLPLKERKDDIPLLARHFLEKYSRKREDSASSFSDRAVEMLMVYDWPGNVRELENAIERAVMLSDRRTLEPSDLQHAPWFHGAQRDSGFRSSTSRTGNESGEVPLVEVEKAHIADVLEQCNGHRIKTAQALGIDRKTLRIKMRKYGLANGPGLGTSGSRSGNLDPCHYGE
ncbi:MAG: sigma-54 dependent transcriptional regulator [Candidatus Latescibacterota bacterium]